MLKNQTVNHVSEHLSAICPVYTLEKGDHGVVDEVSIERSNKRTGGSETRPFF